MAITFYQLLNHYQLKIVEAEKTRLEKAKDEDLFATASIGSLDLMAILDSNSSNTFNPTIDTVMFEELLDSQDVSSIVD